MADRIEARRILVAPTYGLGNPIFVDLGFPPGVVREVALVVPRGVRGSIGVGLGYGGEVVIPNTGGELIYTDGETIVWPTDGLPVGVQWQLALDPQGYASHFIGVRLAVDELPAPTASPGLPTDVTPVPLALPSADEVSPTDLPPDDLPPIDLEA